MGKKSKDLNDARAILRRLRRAGVLEQKEAETMLKAWTQLEHGIAVRDLKAAVRASEAIARALLKVIRG